MTDALPVADRWFTTTSVAEGLTLVVEAHVDRLLRCNIWHVRGRDCDLLVDTGLGLASLVSGVAELFAGREVVAVATHAHLDHVGGLHEFADRRAHGAELDWLDDPPPASLASERFGADVVAQLQAAGYPLGRWLVTARPSARFDPADFRIEAVSPTTLLAEGDVVDLGDRSFEVLHLPGHSPGSIGLWEEATGTLFSGDAVYNGPLLDDLPGSDPDVYRATMERLATLPAAVVHAGHERSFDGPTMHRLARAYLASPPR